MKAPVAVVLVALSVGACASPVRSYVSPSPEPATALSCALRTTAGLGYNPVAGGVNDGYIKFQRPVPNTGGEVAKEVGTRVMTLGMKGSVRPVMDYLTVTGAGNTLRITTVADGDNGKPVKASAQADGHVQAIIAGCSNPGTPMTAPQP